MPEHSNPSRSKLAVTPSHDKGMKTSSSAPLRTIVREYQDDRGVWMHELDCGHRLVAHDLERPHRRRCVYCAKGVVFVYGNRP
jgi:hypothetical protein